MNIDSKLCVVMPAFNEESTIEEIINRVLNQTIVSQLIVVDDCSTDSTATKLKQYESNNKVTVLYHDINKGKGAAIKSAQRFVTEGLTIIQDADLEYNPAQYSKLINPIVNGQADVVIGSRFQTSEERRVLYFWHYFGNKLLTLLSNAFTNLNLTDMECCYVVMKSEYFKSLDLFEKRFGNQPEMIAKLTAMKARFYEVSISYFGRTYAEGKKIKARDGFRAIFCIVYYNSYWQRKKYSKSIAG